MTDPTRYIRDAIITALNGPSFTVYGQVPPGSATTPYGVFSVSIEQRPVKNIKFWTANFSIDIYHDFREYGGRKTIDEITDDIITTLIPNDNAYLSIAGFNHASCRLVSTTERVQNDNSISTYIKTLRFQSLINE